MKLPLSRKTVSLLLIGSGILTLGVGGYFVTRWWRERTVRRRIESFDTLICRYAAQQHLPPQLIRAVIRAESRGDPEAVSGRGAFGLMQVQERTRDEVCRVKRVPPGDLLDPDYNLFIGTIYLRMMLDRFKGDVYLALAAYNWGPTNVARMLREHPGLSGADLVDAYAPAVTRAYCRSIVEDSSVPPLLSTTRP